MGVYPYTNRYTTINMTGIINWYCNQKIQRRRFRGDSGERFPPKFAVGDNAAYTPSKVQRY